MLCDKMTVFNTFSFEGHITLKASMDSLEAPLSDIQTDELIMTEIVVVFVVFDVIVMFVDVLISYQPRSHSIMDFSSVFIESSQIFELLPTNSAKSSFSLMD